jgi:hypothetical protein
MQNPWDQQPKESSRAFSSFVAYRDLGLRRSCNAVARQLKLNPTSILELSKRHNWQERVKAWDAHIDKETQQQQIQAVKIMKQRQIALALKAQKAAGKGIKRLIQQFNTDDGSLSPNAMKPDGLSRLLDTGCRLERLNRDEPEQNLELTQQQNFDNLSLEEVETYRALLLKIGVTR